MKKLFALFLILILTMGLIACSNDSEKTDGNNHDEVKKVSVAVEAASKPLSFEDENGELTGYEVEVLKKLDEIIEEYDFVIESVEAEAVQVGLDAGKYALAGGGMYKTPEREEKYLIPTAISGVSLINIYVKEDDDSIKSLDDLVGKKVVPSSPNGGIYNLLTAYNEENPNNQITIETAEGISVADRFKSVDSGEYDAIVLPNNLGFNEIKESLNLKLKAVETPVRINPTYFILNKNETDLVEKVNEGLNKLIEDGVLSELSVKWFEEDTIKHYN